VSFFFARLLSWKAKMLTRDEARRIAAKAAGHAEI
jgi:hypothetical protein